MELNLTIPCPNCGGQARRSYLTSNEAISARCPGASVIQTECPECDYLLALCSLSGSVIEACPSSTSSKMKHLNSSPQKPSPAFSLL